MTTAFATRLFADWRWFPVALIGTLAIVFAVNGTMVYLALATFPGQAGEDGFDLSNAYGRVLDLSARQSALGWELALEAGPGGHPVVRATDRAGLPLPGAVVDARAERPVGPKEATALTLRPDGPGRLLSEQALAPGGWSVAVTIRQNGETLSTTRRLTLR